MPHFQISIDIQYFVDEDADLDLIGDHEPSGDANEDMFIAAALIGEGMIRDRDLSWGYRVTNMDTEESRFYEIEDGKKAYRSMMFLDGPND